MRWKSLILGGALALGAYTPALAQANAKAEPAQIAAEIPNSAEPAAKIIEARPALWVVKDHDTTIYLFGTIHLLKPQIRWFEGPVRKAFDRSREVVLEIVDGKDPDTQANLMQRAVLRDGTTISGKLDEPARAKFFAALAANGVPAAAFDRVKPWFATLSLSVLPLRSYGYDPESGADHQLELMAAAKGKTLIGLETSDQQIGFFESMPEPLQLTLLSQTIDELPTLGDTIARMIAAWGAGDPDALAAVMNESVAGSPELEKLLLTDRNARWADWIKARLGKPGTVFIAVGAGHLAGTNSVQAMLKARGLKTKRVNRPK